MNDLNTKTTEAAEFDLANEGRIEYGELSEELQARFSAIHRSRLDLWAVVTGTWVRCLSAPWTLAGCRDWLAYRLRPGVEESSEPLEATISEGGA